ncbi:MAG: sigma-70 family RNA polymerase sigma factor [Myxococcales bacterium]|nr:sigma-70 family RNA polymerase sigma factor [Myxococcales bacterium]
MASGLGADELRDLYEEFAPVVHRRALAMLRRDADAWDVVQEVFERMLRSGFNFRREARPMTYVYRVTTNVCLNALRGRKVREPSASSPEEPAVDQAAAEAADLLAALAGRLSERQLRVAALHFVDGLTQEEIGQVLDLSRKTIGRELEAIRSEAAALAGAPGRVEHG